MAVMNFERRFEPQQSSFSLTPGQRSLGGRETGNVTHHRFKGAANDNFVWWNDLSENGQKLYKLLIKEMGDIDLLPIHAAKGKFDLNAAMNELRGHGFLDESRPKILKLK